MLTLGVDTPGYNMTRAYFPGVGTPGYNMTHAYGTYWTQHKLTYKFLMGFMFSLLFGVENGE